MQLKQDTHIHSTYSDGSWTPRQIVRQANKRGLERIAITDHDSVDGIEEAREEAKKYVIKVFNGVELFTEQIYGDMKINNTEILGYKFDNIECLAESTRNARKERVKKIFSYIDELNKVYEQGRVNEMNEWIEELSKGNEILLACKLKQQIDNPISIQSMLEHKFNHEIKEEDIEDITNNTTFVTFDIISYMLKHYIQDPETIHRTRKSNNQGYEIGGQHIKKLGQIFKKMYKKCVFKDGYKPIGRTQEQAIHMITDCGGLPFLAHPGIKVKDKIQVRWLDDYDEKKLSPEEWVESLISYGLKGIELYFYSENGISEEEGMKANQYFYNLAQKYNLLLTYGTDCHGPQKDREPTMG
ncbi:MAG: PHP domain-containing protein, partial [Nanoarchaeota archaeon]|nr:PHP domain-containing protein [Nanoarchaeota archaeon]